MSETPALKPDVDPAVKIMPERHLQSLLAANLRAYSKDCASLLEAIWPFLDSAADGDVDQNELTRLLATASGEGAHLTAAPRLINACCDVTLDVGGDYHPSAHAFARRVRHGIASYAVACGFARTVKRKSPLRRRGPFFAVIPDDAENAPRNGEAFARHVHREYGNTRNHKRRLQATLLLEIDRALARFALQSSNADDAGDFSNSVVLDPVSRKFWLDGKEYSPLPEKAANVLQRLIEAKGGYRTVKKLLNTTELKPDSRNFKNGMPDELRSRITPQSGPGGGQRLNCPGFILSPGN